MQHSIFPALMAGLLALPMLSAPAAGTEAGQGGSREIPGLVSARILPGWVAADGTRMIAIDLQMKPGWKTYWRSPGDAGMAPVFDWGASDNLDHADPVWPAPEVIISGGMRSLGFHDRLVLPVEISPVRQGQPVDVRLSMDFGMCRDLCVPAHLELEAAGAGDAPDPLIEAALARVPAPASAEAQCRLATEEDGLRLSVNVPLQAAPEDADAAIEITGPEGEEPAWVSDAEIARSDGRLTATADLIPDAEDYVFDPDTMRLTLIGADAAVEFTGCTPI